MKRLVILHGLVLEPLLLLFIKNPHPGQDPDESQIPEDLDIGGEVDGVGGDEVGDGEQTKLGVLIIVKEEVLVDPADVEHETNNRNQVCKEDQTDQIGWIDDDLQNNIYLFITKFTKNTTYDEKDDNGDGDTVEDVVGGFEGDEMTEIVEKEG